MDLSAVNKQPLIYNLAIINLMKRGITNMAEIKTITIKVKACPRQTKDGRPFIAFKYQKGNKWVDLHFKREVNLAQFDGMELFNLTGKVQENNAGDYYVYDNAWVSAVDKVEKIK